MSGHFPARRVQQGFAEWWFQIALPGTSTQVPSFEEQLVLTNQDCGVLVTWVKCFCSPLALCLGIPQSTQFCTSSNASPMHMGEWKQNKINPNVPFYNILIKLLYHNWVYHQFLKIRVLSFVLPWLKEYWDSDVASYLVDIFVQYFTGFTINLQVK